MKLTKKTGNGPEGQVKVKTNNWKSKAIIRRKENEKLQKRIKELIISRDGWKAKYKAQKEIRKESIKLSGQKAAGHQYDIGIVILIVALYKYGSMSLRSCRHSLCCMFLSMGLSSRVPSHSSIRNWLCKCGIHRVKSVSNKSGDYVIYVDESITFGSEKILLVLGISKEKITFKNALSHSDMEVLYVGVRKEWKGEAIKAVLDKISIGKNILYAVSDEGANLIKAYKLLNYKNIEDCTHKLANYLKRIYEKDTDFEAFRKLIGKLRQKWNLSKKNNQYMPPSMRGKMRFANIFPCVNWAKKMLTNWNDLSEEVQNSLIFLKEKNDFIQSLIDVGIIFKLVCSKLKNKGFGVVQKCEIVTALSNLKVGQRASVFLNNCKDYLNILTEKRENLDYDNLLCTSDIIESYFGKFKTKINSNSRSGLTEFIFTLATFGQPFSVTETKQALETIKCKHLKLYVDETRAA